MPEKEGAEEKSTKSVVNKKQKQMMGEEGYDHLRDRGRIRKTKDKKDATTLPVSDEVKKTQKVNKGPSALERVKADIEKRYGKDAIMKIKREELDLTKVAESFGGQIVGEPVELDEDAGVISIPLATAAILATGAAGYDSYQKMRGKKGIFPDLSGVVKGVGDTYNKAKDSIMRISGGTDQQRQNQNTRRTRKKELNQDAYNKTKDNFFNKNNKNQNQNQNNRRKKFNKPEVKGDPQKAKSGGETPKGDKTKNVFSRIKDVVVGKSKTGQLVRTAGVSGTTATGVTTAVKNKRGFRLPRPRVPDGGHVGRRSAG